MAEPLRHVGAVANSPGPCWPFCTMCSIATGLLLVSITASFLAMRYALP